mgnify:CR=1 FL=1
MSPQYRVWLQENNQRSFDKRFLLQYNRSKRYVETMKKYILSPLCSAFIVPGLGQILNGHMKKGVIILSIVFLLIVGSFLELILTMPPVVSQSGDIMEKLKGEDYSPLSYFVIVFAIIWLYSVLDAFWVGIRTEGGVPWEESGKRP